MKRGNSLLLALSLAVIFIIGILSPPSLMDDVDSVTAQIARNMIESGDWVTARLDGIDYFEKPALRYWIIALPYKIFGVSDQVARLPIALSAILLCLIVAAIGRWSDPDDRKGPTGTLSGIILATCVGLFLFTRVLIPDVVLTLTTTIAIWAFYRALEGETPKRFWPGILAISLGLGFMLKGVVAFVFPAGSALIYLAITRNLFQPGVWKKLRPLSTLGIILLTIGPWLFLSILRHPPYFDFTLKSEPGKYHGFFWFFFLNEHVFRYLNLRYPRDYNTVPRLAFWLYHLLWLFPWSVFLPLVPRLNFHPTDKTGRLNLLCLIWIGVTLVFFTFSTTQEYYSMPCYPAFALLIGRAISQSGKQLRWYAAAAGAVALVCAVSGLVLLWKVRGIPTTADIATVIGTATSTLSLGRAENLSLASFAYLRLPLALAVGAFVVGAAGAFRRKGRYAVAAFALMMLILFVASRQAMVTLNPYFSSRSLADAIMESPSGKLIVDGQYYAYSSIFFYTGRDALLLNGRTMNLEYGSYEPGARNVFIDDQQLPGIWTGPERHYLITSSGSLERFNSLLGRGNYRIVREAGGKLLLTNNETSVAVTGVRARD